MIMILLAICLNIFYCCEIMKWFTVWCHVMGGGGVTVWLSHDGGGGGLLCGYHMTGGGGYCVVIT